MIQTQKRIRNVGILAHVDAGKTTITERMLAYAGIVHNAGSVDDGDTVTDYLPAEKERGITIQSACVIFDWIMGDAAVTAASNDDVAVNDDDALSSSSVTIQLLDTPGHVDFGVEVNRCVAALDGAILVIDGVAGVQAQTETVWAAASGGGSSSSSSSNTEPLPMVTFINKMDREGSDYSNAIQSVSKRLYGANPILIHIPLYLIDDEDGDMNGGSSSGNINSRKQGRGGRVKGGGTKTKEVDPNWSNMKIVPSLTTAPHGGRFVGMIDIVRFRAVIWPNDDIDNAGKGDNDVVPIVVPLPRLSEEELEEIRNNNSSTSTIQSMYDIAYKYRSELVTTLAECNSDDDDDDDYKQMEECYFLNINPSNNSILKCLRKATIQRKVQPVLVGTALKGGRGVEALLDAIADYLPSPLDRKAPSLAFVNGDDFDGGDQEGGRKRGKRKGRRKSHRAASSINSSSPSSSPSTSTSSSSSSIQPPQSLSLGHSLHPKALAMAFKVLHVSGGKGGGGDGRIVFARIYSGTFRTNDILRVRSAYSPLRSSTVSSSSLTSSSSSTGSNSSTSSSSSSSTSSSLSSSSSSSSTCRNERIGGMLTLNGGRFDRIPDGICQSGGVCALVGLKTVVTGDTITLESEAFTTINGGKKKKKKKKLKNKASNNNGNDNEYDDDEHYSNIDIGSVLLAGVPSPPPVLTVRVEAESESAAKELTLALNILAVEDPSLIVEDGSSNNNDNNNGSSNSSLNSGTILLSGLGELHLEVTLDRLRRERGLNVWTGKPKVSYRETLRMEVGTPGLVTYERPVVVAGSNSGGGEGGSGSGSIRTKAAVALLLKPLGRGDDDDGGSSSNCPFPPSDPKVRIGPRVLEYFGIDDGRDMDGNTTGKNDDMQDEDEDEEYDNDTVRINNDPRVHAIVSGCVAALRRYGPLGKGPLADLTCIVTDVEFEGGSGTGSGGGSATNTIASLSASDVGTLRAAAASAISTVLGGRGSSVEASVFAVSLEPMVTVEVSVPGTLVGKVLSDLASRRGSVGDVDTGGGTGGSDAEGGNGSAGGYVDNRTRVRAEVPVSEMLGYATALRSLTGGEGMFTAEYVGHAPHE